MRPKEAFGLTIRRLRKECGKAQEALAHEAALSLTSLARIETGHQEVRFGTILRLASALGIRGQELVAHAEDTIRRAPKVRPAIKRTKER